MKKIAFIFAAIAMFTSVVLTSCEKEYEFIAPSAKGIAIAPNPCFEGDTVLVYLLYQNIGQYWYYTKQTYTLDGKPLCELTKPDRGALNDHAEYKFIVKGVGEHTLNFTSQISVYAGKSNPFQVGPSTSQKFNVLPREEKPVLGGGEEN